MKKALMFLFSFALVFGLMSSMAFAVDESQHYDFQVRVNGETSVTANVGDEVTVNVVLKGDPSPFQVYAIQDELVYDTTGLQLIDGSNTTAADFRFSTRPMSNGVDNKIIIAYVSFSLNGKTMEDGVELASFKMKVLKQGTFKISSVNYKTSTSSAMDVYASVSNDVTIKTPGGSNGGNGGGGSTTASYSVTFDTNGGSTVAKQTVEDGKKATKPADPTKAGYEFTGWFTDKECTKAFDFNTAIKADTTLYAGWKAAGGTTTNFTDMENHWAKDAVNFVVSKGLFNGTSDTLFSPDENMTRGMLVTVLWRLNDKPAVDSAAKFTDVAAEAYYADAVAWASANGIVNGVSATEFAPNANITREQMAAMMYRYAQFQKYDVSVGESTNILSFDDAAKVSEYAVPSVQWAVGAGLMNGRTETTLVPQGNATRAEVATILQRFVNNVK